mmetsp:Transcript_12549/g.28329  ORF Transcript_12549/g.28329 Transcript_12549/m.28329 type:complete len:912 (-) Transcript_12549:43-2778(-)
MSAVAFRQQVVIQNARLHVLYIFLLLVFIGLILAKFIVLDAWSGVAPTEGFVRLRVSGLYNHTALVDAEEYHLANSSFCTDAQQFDYDTYVDHSCMFVCASGVAQSGCLHPSEIVGPSEQMDTVFLITQFQEKSYLEGSATPQVTNSFVPSVDALLVSVQFSYREAPYGSAREVSYFWNDKQAVHGNQVPVVVLNSGGAVHRVIDAGQPIQFLVSEVLELTGRDLDETTTLAGNAGAVLNRISGLAIEMRIDCYDGARGNPLDDEIEGQRCYLLMLEHNHPWYQMQRTTWLDTSVIVRNSHGIRIMGKIGGSVRKVDWNAVFFEVVVAAIVLRVPKAIVLFVAVACLGRLSKIYRHAIYRNFKVEDQCGSMVTQLVSKGSCFAQMSDVQHENFQMSRARLHAQLQEELLRRQMGLEDTEAHTMANFCYRAATSHKKTAQLVERKNCCIEILDLCAETIQDFLREVLDELGMVHHHTDKQDSASQQMIAFTHFDRMGSAHDFINFDSFLKLFDGSRHHFRTCVEGLLMPARLKIGLDTPGELRLAVLEKQGSKGFGNSEEESQKYHSHASHSTSSWQSARSSVHSENASVTEGNNGEKKRRTSVTSLTSMQRRQQKQDRRSQMLFVSLEDVEKNSDELQQGVEALRKLMRQRMDFFSAGSKGGVEKSGEVAWDEKERELDELCDSARRMASDLISQTVALEGKIKKLQDHAHKVEQAWSKAEAEHEKYLEKVEDLERKVFHEDRGRYARSSLVSDADSQLMTLTKSLNHLAGSIEVSRDMDPAKDPYAVNVDNIGEDEWVDDEDEHPRVRISPPDTPSQGMQDFSSDGQQAMGTASSSMPFQAITSISELGSALQRNTTQQEKPRGSLQEQGLHKALPGPKRAPQKVDALRAASLMKQKPPDDTGDWKQSWF